METISRRNLVKGASLAAVAGMACSGAALAQDASVDTLVELGLVPAAWDYEADLVVLGLGIAGIRAACEAYDQGTSCIVLEKQDASTAGGDSRSNFGGIFLSVHVKDQNLLNTLGNRTEEYCEYIEAQGAELVAWLEAGGNQWHQETGGSSTREEALYSTKGAGPALYQSCLNNLAKTDVNVMYETKATKLVKNPVTGEILGVLAEQGGAQIAVKAKKAVVIATGGYSANDDLMQAFHHPGVTCYPVGGPFNTGDGLKFGADAGVALYDIARSVEYAAPVARAASDENGGVGIFMAWPENFYHYSKIFVNAEGKRFMDEETVLTHWKNDTIPFFSFDYVKASAAANIDAGYVNLPMYLIVDQACFEANPLGNTYASWSWSRLCEYGGYVWSEDNQAELEKGWITKGETLEELAQNLGIDPAGLVATVEEWNAGCEAGADKFGRQEITLTAFGEGPYYGFELAPSVIYTVGGLKANSNCEAVDNFDNAIPRLYVAGNVGLGAMYPLGLDGAAAQGRRCAANAAKLSDWDA